MTLDRAQQYLLKALDAFDRRVVVISPDFELLAGVETDDDKPYSAFLALSTSARRMISLGVLPSHLLLSINRFFSVCAGLGANAAPPMR